MDSPGFWGLEVLRDGKFGRMVKMPGAREMTFRDYTLNRGDEQRAPFLRIITELGGGREMKDFWVCCERNDSHLRPLFDV